MNFPEAHDVKDPLDALSVTYTTLKHYELAPSNLSKVSSAGLTFAITSSDLRLRTSFLTNLRKAVKNGLPEAEALKALTITPASYIGASDLVGSVKKNMIANLLVTSGNIFSDDCVVYENWVQGVPYRFIDLRIKDLRGTYSLKVDTADYKLILSGTFDKPTIKMMVDSTEVRGATFTLDKDIVSINFDRTRQKFRLTGYIDGKNIEGKGQLDSGSWVNWKATWSDSKTEPDSRPRRTTPVTEPGK
ncbi:MAG: amidohydrolase family protein [Bacteroidales bacterium]|nr:amidohydrolase family protein [Bacteroidales bacterium]